MNEQISTNLQNFLLERFAPAVLIFLAGYLLQLTAAALIHTAAEKATVGRVKTLGTVLKNAFGIVILTVATTMALSRLGLDIGPILAGAGIAGLAIGFGAQTLVRDLVTGFFILSENQYNIGDEVEIAGVKGLVREIKLRTTTLVDENGTVHIIPNSTITRVSKYPKKN